MIMAEYEFENEFEILDKLIDKEINFQSIDNKYDQQCVLTECSNSVLEGAYSKIAFYSETIWWDPDQVDEYRVNNLGLWSAVMGCDRGKLNQNMTLNKKLSDVKTEKKTYHVKKKEKDKETKDSVSEDDETREWLKRTPWPSTILKQYPQIPEAVASKNLSIFSNFQSSFAGDLLFSKISNVKELIQYNRLKQDCVKNLWNKESEEIKIKQDCAESLPKQTKNTVQKETAIQKAKNQIVAERKKDRNNITLSSNEKITINEICNSFNAIISQNNVSVKSEVKNDRLEVKLKLLERNNNCNNTIKNKQSKQKTFHDFQREFENVFNNFPPLFFSKDDYQKQVSQCKKIKTENIDHGCIGNNYANSCSNNCKSGCKGASNGSTMKENNNCSSGVMTDITKKNRKFSDRASSLIKENFGSISINEGEIIETLEEVCQWLHNVYPKKNHDDLGMSNERLRTDSEREYKQNDMAIVKKKNINLIPTNIIHSSSKRILTRQMSSGEDETTGLPNITYTTSSSVNQSSRKLYRDCLEADPVNKFAELEREAIEQYSGCSINSENSIALLQLDEDSKFKDLEREAIEQYQPEEDSIITSGELFTPSELLKHSPGSSPDRVKSPNTITIIPNNDELIKCDLNSSLQQKSSSDYLLCSDTWNDQIDHLFTKKSKDNNNYLKIVQSGSEIKFEAPIRILKPPPRKKESTVIVDGVYESLHTLKNSTYTFPYDSPTDEHLEDNGTNVVKYMLKKKQNPFGASVKNNIKEKDENRFPREKELEEHVSSISNENHSKIKDSDEDHQNEDDIKKKKKKKKRSRKKKSCKKDGGGGGPGGGNGRGGVKCDARTPMHCIPLAISQNKANETRSKKKEESNKKEKKLNDASNSLLFKYHRLNYIMLKTIKCDENQRKQLYDDLTFDEHYLKYLSTNAMETSFIFNYLKRIPNYLFHIENSDKTSVLFDSVYSRLHNWRWCYITQYELLNKCLYQCCNSQHIGTGSWMKWCKCYSVRIGSCHYVQPGCNVSLQVCKISPCNDLFNPKYWELDNSGIIQGVFIQLPKSLNKIQSIIYSAINNTPRTHKYFIKRKSFKTIKSDAKINASIFINNLIPLLPINENNIQKIYHLCKCYGVRNLLEIPTNVSQYKKTRNKFYRGKNNKIKGKTFCYYCSGKSFKNYTLHTFFSEVDATNKGATNKEQTKKVWGSLSTKNIEKEVGNEIEENYVQKISDHKKCLVQGCIECEDKLELSEDEKQTKKDKTTQIIAPKNVDSDHQIEQKKTHLTFYNQFKTDKIYGNEMRKSLREYERSRYEGMKKWDEINEREKTNDKDRISDRFNKGESSYSYSNNTMEYMVHRNAPRKLTAEKTHIDDNQFDKI